MLESARRLADLDGVPAPGDRQGPRRSSPKAKPRSTTLPVWVGRALPRTPPGHLHQPGPPPSSATARRTRPARGRAVEVVGHRDPTTRYPTDALDETVEAAAAPPIPRHHPRFGHPLGLRGHAPAITPSVIAGSGRPDRRRADRHRRRRRHLGPAQPGRRCSIRCPTRGGNWSPGRPPTSDGGDRPSGTRPVQRDDGRAMFEVTCPRAVIDVYDLVPAERPSSRARSTGRTPASLENEHLRVELDDRACCHSVFDKAAGREVLAPGARGNLLPAPPRLPQLLRRLGHRPVRLRPGRSTWTRSSRWTWSSEGPLRAGIRVVRALRRLADHPGHRGWRRIAPRRLRHRGGLARDQPAPEGGVPGRRARSLRATYEIQYGHVERPTHANTQLGRGPLRGVRPQVGRSVASPATASRCSTTASTATTSRQRHAAVAAALPRPGPIP